MTQFVGVSSLDSTDLKQEALLFDRIAVADLKEASRRLPEVQWLFEKGVVFQPMIRLSEEDSNIRLEEEQDSIKLSRYLNDLFGSADDPYTKQLIGNYLSKNKPLEDGFAVTYHTHVGMTIRNNKRIATNYYTQHYTLHDERLLAAVLRIQEGIDAALVSHNMEYRSLFKSGDSSVISVVLKHLPITYL